MKPGKDTVDIDPNTPKDDPKTSVKPTGITKPATGVKTKPVEPKSTSAKPTPAKPAGAKLTKESKDLADADPNDPIEIALKARQMGKADVLTGVEAAKLKVSVPKPLKLQVKQP